MLMKNQFRHNENGTTSIFYTKLTTGETPEALIDTEDFEIVNSLKTTWFICKNSKNGKYRVKGKINGKNVYLYRLILNAHPDEVVDHINGDTLNNTKSNLRLTSQRINMQNQKARGDLPRNVYFYPRDKKYRVQLLVNGKRKSFGLHNTVEEAEQVAIKARRTYLPESFV
jgi:hypothetical protein